MARPIKKGLDYFPIDTDIFDNIQIRKLKKRYKSLGFLVYFTLLCDVYKKEGYFLQLSDDYVYDLSERLGDTEETVEEIIDYCLQVNLFNRQKYDLYNVLTSKSIQERYILVAKRCKNPICEEFNCINAPENDINVPETGVSVTEMRQRKEKESKVNIERESACACEAEIVEKGFDEMCSLWQKELLADQEWCASAVRQSGIGTDFYAMIPDKMHEFQDFIISSGEKDTIQNKKDYARRFHYWWLYHGAKKHSGGANILGKPERKSRVQEILELGESSTKLALALYNQAI